MTLIVNFTGFILIAGVIWWFWLYRPHSDVKASMNAPVNIIVEDGVYVPAVISATVGYPLILKFLRKDSSPCSKTVLFEDFGISEELPLNQEKEIVITPTKAGVFEFTCQMKMYRGTLEIQDNSTGA